MENVEKEEGCFMKQVEEIMRSKNFTEICETSLENSEDKKLEDNLEKFREGIGICAEWLGKTYGVHSTQRK